MLRSYEINCNIGVLDNTISLYVIGCFYLIYYIIFDLAETKRQKNVLKALKISKIKADETKNDFETRKEIMLAVTSYST